MKKKYDEDYNYCGPSNWPSWIRKMFSTTNKSCYLHDVAYTDKIGTQEQADKKLRDNMKTEQSGLWGNIKANLFYYAVKKGGHKRWGKK